MAGIDHLEQILDNVPSALISVGPDRKVIYRNRTATELAPQLAPGTDVWEALRPVANEEKIDRMMRGERMLMGVTPESPILEWMIAEEKPTDGSVILMVWDPTITDEIVQGRITFIIGASHELRSPLTALLGFAEILELESERLTPEQAEAVSIIHQNAQHLHSLVDDIIDLSQNSFGDLRLNLETIEIAPIVESVGETLLPQIEAKGQSLSVTTGPDLPAIEADRQRIRQIIVNLLQNAHVHTPAGSSITITVDQAEEGIRTVIADNGTGLPFDDLDDAFRSFRRGPDTGKAAIPGSGVGLTISRQLAELHRGTLKAEPEPEEGTAFELWLPLDREKARLSIAPKL